MHMYIHHPLSPPTNKESILSLRHPEGAVGFRPATRGEKTEITKTGDFLTDHVISDSPIMFLGLKKE